MVIRFSFPTSVIAEGPFDEIASLIDQLSWDDEEFADVDVDVEDILCKMLKVC